jgi:hypothetical protein
VHPDSVWPFMKRHGIKTRSVRDALVKKGHWRLTAVAPEVIRSRYWDDRQSVPRIARDLGVSSTSLHSYMVRHGIPRRPRSEACRLREKERR